MGEISTNAPDPLSKAQAAELKKALAQLTSRKEHKRLAARAKLDALGVNKRDRLLALLKQETREHRTNQRCTLIGIGIYMMVGLLLLIIPPLLGRKPEWRFLLQMSSMTGAIVAAVTATSTQKSVTRLLEEFDDKQTVGAWAQALEYNDKKIPALARAKLIKLLPQLNASDAHLLDDEQRAILYKTLHKHPDRSDPNTDLHQAILKALQQVGDERAMPHVERLAKGEGLAVAFPELQEEAAECLPFLKDRVEQLRASQTLLRASSAFEAPSSNSDVLLRPALDAGATPAQELLRATALEVQQNNEVQEKRLVTTSGTEEVHQVVLQSRNE